MGLGPKIKEFRVKTGLTQKELADALHVTYQAVSRWENDDSEPSLDTVKEMTKIFKCSTDDLFGIEQKEQSEETKEETAAPVQVVEKVIVQEAKPVLAVCEQCNKPIYESNEINRITEKYSVRHGRSHHTEYKQKVLCQECNQKRIEKEKREAAYAAMARKERFRKRRIHSFVWPGIVAAIFLILGIVALCKGDSNKGIWEIVIGIGAYCFLGTVILDNTFITEMWLGIAQWGFVKFPGIIFEFSIDGFAFLIAMKLLFWALGIMLAILAMMFATALAMALSVFVYPFAIKKNLNGVE